MASHVLIRIVSLVSHVLNLLLWQQTQTQTQNILL